MLLLAVLMGVLSGARARALPNIVLVSIDTLRADHLGCYGYTRPTSPNLDRLAGQGVVFTDVSAPSPWTRPSHASLLTGLYPSRHGVKTPAQGLNPAVATLAERFAAAGYATTAIVNSEHLGKRFGLMRGFDSFEYVSEWSRWPPWRKRIVDAAEPVTDRALRELAAAGPSPFFLFVHYYDPHSDYAPRAEYARLFVGPYAGTVDGTTEQLLDIQRTKRPLVRADRDHLVDLYDAEIRQLDAQLARLFKFLDERGLAATTVVAVTSDHGEEFLEHGSVLHGHTLFQELLAVPLIVRGPGLPAGIRATPAVSLVDIAPTLLSIAGVPNASAVDGLDLSGQWTADPPALPDRAVFAEADSKNAEPDIERMARRGRWKLCYDRLQKTSRLYDLVADPAEQLDRSDGDRQIVDDLSARLERFMHGEGAVAEPIVVPAAARERLRSLGYE